MLRGILEVIFSCIGIYGVFTNNIACMVISLIFICIGHYIDIFIVGHNPGMIFVAILLATGASFANKDPLYNFTLALCMNNIVIMVIAIPLFIIGFIKAKNSNKNKYIQLSAMIMQGINITDINEAIDKVYNFYKEEGIAVESITPKENKQQYLSEIVMLAIDTTDIDEAIVRTRQFYGEQKQQEEIQ